MTACSSLGPLWQFNGSTLAGKPAVLWFWTPWCPFCNAEAPGVSAVAAANPAVTFVGVAPRSDTGAMQNFVDRYRLGFTNLNDADRSIWARTTCRGNRPASAPSNRPATLV